MHESTEFPLVFDFQSNTILLDRIKTAWGGVLVLAGLTSLPFWCSAGFAMLSADLQDSAQNSHKTIKSRNKIQKKPPWAVLF